MKKMSYLFFLLAILNVSVISISAKEINFDDIARMAKEREGEVVSDCFVSKIDFPAPNENIFTISYEKINTDKDMCINSKYMWIKEWTSHYSYGSGIIRYESDISYEYFFKELVIAEAEWANIVMDIIEELGGVSYKGFLNDFYNTEGEYGNFYVEEGDIIARFVRYNDFYEKQDLNYLDEFALRINGKELTTSSTENSVLFEYIPLRYNDDYLDVDLYRIDPETGEYIEVATNVVYKEIIDKELLPDTSYEYVYGENCLAKDSVGCKSVTVKTKAKSADTPVIKEDIPENPKTGLVLPVVSLVSLSLIGLYILKRAKKNNRFMDI